MIWNSQYETGNERVDNEHKEIFMRVEKVMASLPDGDASSIDSTMDFLASYTVNHFAHEESLMAQSNYPHMAVHKKQHDDFLAEVSFLIKRVKNESDNTKNGEDITRVIVNWLTDHVLGSDKVMADYYRKWVKG